MEESNAYTPLPKLQKGQILHQHKYLHPNNIINLTNYSFLKKLGVGGFSKVLLVQQRGLNSNYYALKCISKKEIRAKRLLKNINDERSALHMFNSPYLLHSYRELQDSSNVYFLTQFVNGVQLFQVIQMHRLLPVRQVVFYGAQLVLALKSMHLLGYVYRDLKPDNVMVTAGGYLKLIDLGACCRVGANATLSTPSYSAPEVLRKQVASFASDLWSLGVVLYQCLTGVLLYGNQSQDPAYILKQMQNRQVQCMEGMDQDTISLIRQLLSRNQKLRFGVEGELGIEQQYQVLQKHNAFKSINWNSIGDQSAVPEYLLPPYKITDVDRLKPKCLSSVIKNSNKENVQEWNIL